MSFSMPMVGLGTWLISNDEVSRVVTDALNLGYKHIDTAQVYQNESGIGEAISKISIEIHHFNGTPSAVMNQLDEEDSADRSPMTLMAAPPPNRLLLQRH